ncbi:MAG: YjjG family noncanonical pyrimidine nucleotidase [Clostridia bacterium]|nr:YjjG family noncanonical pyrimidine nucleotidase [Clostridia bacterium]
MIRVILWDIDGTLLDFAAAEREAIRGCFAAFGLGACTDQMLARYSVINRQYWEKLERKELTKPQVLIGRFEVFFAEEGLVADCVAFNDEYQIRLGDTVCFHDDGFALVQQLKGRVRQYAVTNGTKIAQQRKLHNSGLDALLDGVFISEDIGVEKPGVEFFHSVWETIGPYEPDEVLIVGDSLTSDMQGGNNAGIRCCWYNPKGAPAPEHLKIDYNIRDLREILAILEQ